MGDKLNQFKMRIINNSINNYNKSINNLNNNYVSLINKIKKSRNTQKIKNIYIQNLINEFNGKRIKLNKILNEYISNINALNYNNISNSNKIYRNALLVGINYLNTNYQLNGCINDANFMNDKLLELGFNNIKILTDDTIEKPTKNNIINNLSTLLSNANIGDVIIFHYSGHGSYVLDKNNEEITGYDQVIVPLDFNVITDDELKNIVEQNLKKGVVLIGIFDSCFSQSILDTKYQYLDSLNNNDFFINVKENETNGNVIVISGCSDIQTSADAIINNVGRGAMSWSFLETLKNNKDISWKDLIIKMRELLKNANFGQIPQLSSSRFIDIDEKVII